MMAKSEHGKTVAANGTRFTRRAGAGKSLCHKNNHKARRAADLHVRRVVGLMRLLDAPMLFREKFPHFFLEGLKRRQYASRED